MERAASPRCNEAEEEARAEPTPGLMLWKYDVAAPNFLPITVAGC
jgi:hypothetical protein